MHRRCCLLVTTTSCKRSLVLLRMGEIIARNMLSWLKLLIKLLLLYLVGCLYYYFMGLVTTPFPASQETHRFLTNTNKLMHCVKIMYVYSKDHKIYIDHISLSEWSAEFLSAVNILRVAVFGFMWNWCRGGHVLSAIMQLSHRSSPHASWDVVPCSVCTPIC